MCFFEKKNAYVFVPVNTVSVKNIRVLNAPIFSQILPGYAWNRKLHEQNYKIYGNLNNIDFSFLLSFK